MRRKRRLRLERQFGRVNAQRCHLIELKHFAGRLDLDSQIEALNNKTDRLMNELHPICWKHLEELERMVDRAERAAREAQALINEHFAALRDEARRGGLAE